MKIKRYNKETLPVRSGGGIPLLKLNRNSGTITFGKDLTDHIGLKSGDLVEFIQNEEAPKEWFITVSNVEHGLPTRPNKSQAGFIVQNSSMVQVFYKALGIDINCVSMRVGKEPLLEGKERFFPILTSSYKEFLKTK